MKCDNQDFILELPGIAKQLKQLMTLLAIILSSRLPAFPVKFYRKAGSREGRMKIGAVLLYRAAVIAFKRMMPLSDSERFLSDQEMVQLSFYGASATI
jgi:hypothetical protein